MTVDSYAKINLDLRVGPPRADGFHPIRSWFVTVGLSDRLTFAFHDGAAGDTLRCDDAAVPTDGRNLVLRAARVMPRPPGAGVAVTLEKRIPAGGGLGGGSSNAAAALAALNAAWRSGLTVDRLQALAATLGSDVPFFLHGPSSVCRGRGELVTAVRPPACRAAMLLLPGFAMPTPAVFRRLDERRRGVDEAFDEQAAGPESLAGLSAVALLPRLVNDLEAPAFELSPALALLRRRAESILGRPVRMTGSGSTLFTLYDGPDDARAAAASATASLGVRCVAVALAPSPAIPNGTGLCGCRPAT